VLPWYQQPRLRLAGAALLAGLVIGGLVTLALSYQNTPPAAIPEGSAADAIASDQSAVATATPAATARPKASARPAKKPKRTLASVAVSSAATAEPTATATPEDEELGNSPASTPAPTRSAPRRQRTVNTPRRQVKPVSKRTPAKAAPTPQPSTPPAATPAPAAATPQPAATPPPTATPAPKPPKPPKPHPRPGGGEDGEPGSA
jgi:hypothetical protein